MATFLDICQCIFKQIKFYYFNSIDSTTEALALCVLCIVPLRYDLI